MAWVLSSAVCTSDVSLLAMCNTMLQGRDVALSRNHRNASKSEVVIEMKGRFRNLVSKFRSLGLIFSNYPFEEAR